jgi:AmmeMemoRadiSam system protein A
MKDLLLLCRTALETYFKDIDLDISDEIKKKYSENKACFVTITKNNELRGVVGHIMPSQELWKDAIENAVSAATCDPRFPPMDFDELKDVKLELSVLTVPEKLEYTDFKDLLKKLTGEEGVIIGKGECSATFLPQVWEELSHKEVFLSELCKKAGLHAKAWKEIPKTPEDKLEVYTYPALAIKEE